MSGNEENPDSIQPGIHHSDGAVYQFVSEVLQHV